MPFVGFTFAYLLDRHRVRPIGTGRSRNLLLGLQSSKPHQVVTTKQLPFRIASRNELAGKTASAIFPNDKRGLLGGACKLTNPRGQSMKTAARVGSSIDSSFESESERIPYTRQIDFAERSHVEPKRAFPNSREQRGRRFS